MIEFFNFYYILYIALALALVIGLYFFLRNKSKKTAQAVLFGILLSSFMLHFLKLFADYYQVWMPYSIRTVTPENFCAVNVLIFPWLFLSKKAILKDYMFYMGMMSGIGAMIIPIDVIGYTPFEFETIRFYLAHILLWVVPLLMVLLKLHTLDYRRILKVPFMLFFFQGIILVNEVILAGIGFVRMENFFSYEIRNAAFIFGPMPSLDFLGVFFTALSPEVFRTIPIGANAGAVFYWPIVWLIIPVFIYFSLGSLLLALPFEYGNIKKGIFALREKIMGR